jgi:predicted glycosyltransferase
MASGRPSSTNKRSILLYSHDTYGLGHFRRNTAIAHAVRRKDPTARLVMLTGSALAGDWLMPEAAELVRMPSVIKVGAEDYQPATPRSMSGLRAERAGIIFSTLLSVRPDVFLVDHSPLGMKGELKRSLELARDQLPDTRVVLGLRDILDEPDTVRRTWIEQGVYSALDSLYDEVLVYGCRELFDVTEQYAFPESVRRRTTFTGYVAKDHSQEPPASGAMPWTSVRSIRERRILVMGGGGGDAADVFHAFIDAWPLIAKTGRKKGLLVTGPLMRDYDRAELKRLATRTGLELIRSSTNMLSLIAAADVVVSMGGYNSVVESLSARRPLVIFPRIAPRQEQLIRARMLERLGLASVVPPGPGAAGQLSRAVLRALNAPSPGIDVWRRIDLGGGERVAQLLLEPVRSQAIAG